MAKNARQWGAVMTIFLWTGSVIAQEYTVEQRNKTFVLGGNKIDKLAISVGETIHFKNMDPWFHNIYSLSEIKTFDLGSYPQGQFKSVTFDKAGPVEVECAIHPQMLLKVEVKERAAK